MGVNCFQLGTFLAFHAFGLEESVCFEGVIPREVLVSLTLLNARFLRSFEADVFLDQPGWRMFSMESRSSSRSRKLEFVSRGMSS